MKTNLCWPSIPLLGAIFSLLVATVPGYAAAPPVITSVKPSRDSVAIVVSVPDGVKRVVLETKTRVSASAWTPAATQATAGSATNITFTLPTSERMELIRARADFSLPLPQKFYGPTNTYYGGPTNDGGARGLPSDNTTGGFDTAERTVQESDIWKVRGDTLFFFNQYRGLQIIDVGNPDDSKILGVYPMAAAGEDMYVLGSTNVVLLARNGCSYPTTSQVLILAVSNGIPSFAASAPVEGYITESRMVGTALYVASQTLREFKTGTNAVWQWGTVVSSYDLSTPSLPVPRNVLWYPGYGLAITATDSLLFVALPEDNDSRSTVQVLDITSPDARIAQYASVPVKGRIADKFKMHYENGILTTIAEAQSFLAPFQIRTVLETFRLPHPNSASPLGPIKLGEIEVGHGERLFATRFDGNKAYIVTFLRTDPLWIVDISNPSAPKVVSELEVPGWSTYIHPMGDHLLSIGVETNRVAVSLFNVANPAKPFLASRVLLGQSYSWSEANYDEKAAAVLEDVGLVLVPFSGDTINGWSSKVQLIDLTSSNLVARGTIEHKMQPRRSAYLHDRILSLSGWELLTVNATNRDQPTVTHALPLAWNVDRVFVADHHLLQIGGGGFGWEPAAESTLTVSSLADPNMAVGTLSLGLGRVAGAAFTNGLLFVAQTEFVDGRETNNTEFTLTIVDARNLPALKVLGRAVAQTSDMQWSWGEWTPLWVKGGLLVWSGGGGGGWWGGPWMSDSISAMPMLGLWRWPSFGGGGGHLLAFDISVPSAPALTSDISLSSEKDLWATYSTAFAVDALVYVSRAQSELLPGSTNTYVQRHYLQVVDYTDASEPILRKPVNIPGALQGTSHGGELLYTKGQHSSDSEKQDWREYLDAVSYDGVGTHLVASLPLPNTWPQPLKVDGANIYLGRVHYATSTNTESYSFERWSVHDTGEFKTDASTALSNPVTDIWTANGVAAVQVQYDTLEFFDTTAPNALRFLDRFKTDGCVGLQLNHAHGSRAGVALPLGAFGVAWRPLGN